MNDKWICIKKYEIDFISNIGDIVLIIEYDNGAIFIGPYSKNDTVPMWVGNKEVYKHFITMAQWREQQINSIIND